MSLPPSFPPQYHFLTSKAPITYLKAANFMTSNLRASHHHPLFRTVISFRPPLGRSLSHKMILAGLGVTRRLQDYDRRSAWPLFTCESCPASYVICHCCPRCCLSHPPPPPVTGKLHDLLTRRILIVWGCHMKGGGMRICIPVFIMRCW